MNARQKQFKKQTDAEEFRKRRENNTIQIRKSKKEEHLKQRRRMVSSVLDTEENSNVVDISNELMMNLKSLDQNVKLKAVSRFRKILSLQRNPPIQQVIDANVVPIFIECLKVDDHPKLQFEAAWALTNIASGTSEHTKVVIHGGAVPMFCTLLLSDSMDVREQAVWALGNIAGDSPHCRDMVLRSGALEPLLLQLSRDAKMSMMRNATWTLSNFCRGKPQPDFDIVFKALPTLAHLIYSQDEEVIADACWALSYLSDGSNSKIQTVIESGVGRRLVELLMHPMPSVQTPALRAIGNIVTGDDLQTQIIINCAVLPCLLALLASPKQGIRKEACWTISNITAGDKNQILGVIQANIIPPLVDLMSNDKFDIRKEAAWAISNATSGGTLDTIKYLVSQGCILPLCQLLEVADAKLVMVSLDGLENILKAGEMEAQQDGTGCNQVALMVEEADGIHKIQALQYHENEEIYQKSVRIVENFFGVEEEDDVEIAPATNPDAQQFQFGTTEQSSHMFNFPAQ